VRETPIIQLIESINPELHFYRPDLSSIGFELDTTATVIVFDRRRTS
jgi:hypothetical protein